MSPERSITIVIVAIVGIVLVGFVLLLAFIVLRASRRDKGAPPKRDSEDTGRGAGRT